MTGVPDSQVLLHDGENDSVATDDSCEIHPTWNASVCTGDIRRLNLSDSRGELPRAVDLESRTARFALLASLGPNAPNDAMQRTNQDPPVHGVRRCNRDEVERCGCRAFGISGGYGRRK